MTANPPSAKEMAAAVARVRLDAFLRSGRTLDFRPAGPPRVSVLMLLCNRAEVTLSCLLSLAARLNETPFELILVDNGSTDATRELLSRLEGVTVVTNPANVGFPKGVNQAAARATGDYLLLLNNDTEVLGRSIDAAADYLDRTPDVAMVGGRVVLLDGTLQEAGCMLWRDGWACQFARGWAPDDPAVAFERDVDYCSAAFAMVRRGLFEAAGGLDEVFSPGYFEDPDLAVKLRRAGWRIVYLPDVAILHYENATSAALFDLPELCVRNHQRFRDRHADWLADQLSWDPRSVVHLRRADDTALNVLYVPNARDPADVGRVARSLEALDAMVTVGVPAPEAAPPALPRTVEVVRLGGAADADRLLAGRPGYFDLALFDTPPAPELAAVLARHGVRWATRQGTAFRFAA